MASKQKLPYYYFTSKAIDQARTRAKKYLLQISDGKKPIKEKQIKRQESYTLDFVFAEYLEKRNRNLHQ